MHKCIRTATMLKAVLTISVILSITAKVDSLQCYVCYDCLEIKDEYVASCDSLVSTTTPASTTTTASSTLETTTTIAPGTNTTTNTEAPDTNTTTTTLAPETNTTTTTEAAQTNTTTTTEAPETNTTNTTLAPETNTTTTTEAPETNTTTLAPENATLTTAPETNTFAPTDTTEFRNQLLTAETSLRRVKRADVTYECFQGKIHVNNTDVIVRGCAVGRTNETCEQFGLSGCSFCNTDKCNSGWTIQSSSIVLLAAVFLTLVIKE